MNFDILHNFISPVTGRVLSPTDYILLGDQDGIATPSPILIDMRLDMIDFRYDLNELFDSTFILQTGNVKMPNAQALDLLDDGFMFNNSGVISTINTPPLPSLTENKLWKGDENNQAVEVQTIDLDNLPSLGTTIVPNPLTLGFVGEVYEGTESGIPQASSIVADMFADIAILNAKFLTGKFIMKSGLTASYPVAQFLDQLTAGGIVKTNSIGDGSLVIASGGSTIGVDDYVTPLALEEAIETQAIATTAEIAESATATEAAAFAAFSEEMLPYIPSPIPLTGIGFQISGAIIAAGTAAEAAANLYTDSTISNLTIDLNGDISGSGLLSSTINTTFIPNPIFTGNEAITIPTGNTAQRPISPTVGMMRFNTDLVPFPEPNPFLVLGTVNEIEVDNTDNSFTVSLAEDAILPGLRAITIPTGNTAQRPISPTVGMMRFNTDLVPFPEPNPFLVLGTVNEIEVDNTDNSFTVSLAEDPYFKGNQYLKLPTGTTAQRPINPEIGMVRVNTNL